jgi:hypothetical protein
MPAHWELHGCLHRATCPRSFGLTGFELCQAQPASQRWSNHCCFPSPTDALIDLKLRCQLSCFVPVWHWLHTLTALRIACVPQRRPAWGVMCGGCVCALMCSSICRMSALKVMKALMRICPPHRGHAKGNNSSEPCSCHAPPRPPGLCSRPAGGAGVWSCRCRPRRRPSQWPK